MVTPSIVPLNSNGSQWVIKQGHILTPHLFKCYSQNPYDQTPIKKKKRPMIWFLQYWHISLCWALETHLLKTTKNNNKNPFFIFTKNTYEITKMNQFFFFITCYEFNCDNTKWQAFPIWIKISNDLYHIIEGFGFGGPKKMREGAL